MIFHKSFSKLVEVTSTNLVSDMVYNVEKQDGNIRPKTKVLLTLLICLYAREAFTQLVLVNKSSKSLRLAKSRLVKAMFYKRG